MFLIAINSITIIVPSLFEHEFCIYYTALSSHSERYHIDRILQNTQVLQLNDTLFKISYSQGSSIIVFGPGRNISSLPNLVLIA